MTGGRIADHPISAIFLERWSPRTFTGEPMSDADLAPLFEAARWAPSSSNLQPWRFLYAKRDTPHFPLFFDALYDGNKGWAAKASVLVAVLSKTMIAAKDDRPERSNHTHSFDTGAAWACLALQASLTGWTAHAIGGFDLNKAAANLNVPDGYRLECLIAIGRYVPDATPAVPNSRSSQTTFVREGPFVA